jgi:hypothetical protein
VRHSKPRDGPVLRFNAHEWEAFLGRADWSGDAARVPRATSTQPLVPLRLLLRHIARARSTIISFPIDPVGTGCCRGSDGLARVLRRSPQVVEDLLYRRVASHPFQVQIAPAGLGVAWLGRPAGWPRARPRRKPRSGPGPGTSWVEYCQMVETSASARPPR